MAKKSPKAKNAETIEDLAEEVDGEVVEPQPKRAVGARLTMVERIKMAQRITAGRLKKPPVTFTKLAEAEGVSQQTAIKLHKEWVEQVELTDDPIRIVEETLAIYSAAIEKFAEEAETGDLSSARVGATRSMVEAAKGRLELLAAIGKLPRNLGALQDHEDTRRLIMEFAKVIEDHDLPSAVVEDILKIVEGDRTLEAPKG